MTHERATAPEKGSGHAEHAEISHQAGSLASDVWGKQAPALDKTAAAPLPGQNPAFNFDISGSGAIHISDNKPAAAPEQLEIPPVFAPQAAMTELPLRLDSALSSGAAVRFSSEGENKSANTQPDYFFTPEGKLVPNPAATPSADGSINIQIQTQKQEDNKSLRDAIMHENENQKAAAKDMIRLFQKAHPGKPVPSWMQDLADAKPNLPDFVPSRSADNAPVTPPPENGFSNRGVSGGGSGGFANNGGFDSKGYFHGNGGSGDGSISTGGSDSKGRPLGPGEQVQAKQLYDYFVEKGFSPAQASGILGNIQTESSFKTNAYNAGEGAIGLCQWEGGRRTALESFAAQQNKPVTDWHVQADFIMHELTHSESRAYANLKAAETPEQAAKVFQSQYERSACLGDRAANARNIHNQLA